MGKYPISFSGVTYPIGLKDFLLGDLLHEEKQGGETRAKVL